MREEVFVVREDKPSRIEVFPLTLLRNSKIAGREVQKRFNLSEEPENLLDGGQHDWIIAPQNRFTT